MGIKKHQRIELSIQKATRKGDTAKVEKLRKLIGR